RPGRLVAARAGCGRHETPGTWGVRGGEVTGRDGVHASVKGSCGRAAPENRSWTKTPGTSRFPALWRPESRGPGRAVDFDPPIGGSNPGHVFVTSEEDGRKSHVPGASVTRPDFGDGSGTPS